MAKVTFRHQDRRGKCFVIGHIIRAIKNTVPTPQVRKVGRFIKVGRVL